MKGHHIAVTVAATSTTAMKPTLRDAHERTIRKPANSTAAIPSQSRPFCLVWLPSEISSSPAPSDQKLAIGPVFTPARSSTGKVYRPSLV